MFFLGTRRGSAPGVTEAVCIESTAEFRQTPTPSLSIVRLRRMGLSLSSSKLRINLDLFLQNHLTDVISRVILALSIKFSISADHFSLSFPRRTKSCGARSVNYSSISSPVRMLSIILSRRRQRPNPPLTRQRRVPPHSNFH